MHLSYYLREAFLSLSLSLSLNDLHLDQQNFFLSKLIRKNAKNCFPRSFEQLRYKSHSRQIQFRVNTSHTINMIIIQSLKEFSADLATTKVLWIINNYSFATNEPLFTTAK